MQAVQIKINMVGVKILDVPH